MKVAIVSYVQKIFHFIGCNIGHSYFTEQYIVMARIKLTYKVFLVVICSIKGKTVYSKTKSREPYQNTPTCLQIYGTLSGHLYYKM